MNNTYKEKERSLLLEINELRGLLSNSDKLN